MRSSEVDAGQEPVVKGALYQVGVLRFARDHQHPPGEHDRGDGCAGFAVASFVGQLVRIAERLVAVVRPDAAGQVGLVATISAQSRSVAWSRLASPVSRYTSATPASR